MVESSFKEKISKATELYSGQVWIVKCPPDHKYIPVTPSGEN